MIVMSLFLVSCSDDDTTPTMPLGDYENGILISGEGGPAGTISFVSEDLTSVENQIYFNVNNEALGVYLQSIGFYQNVAYLITDTANTITFVDRYTFEKFGTMTAGLENPRFIAFANGKAYVTNWADPLNSSDDFIAVVELVNYTVVETISVGEGPEQLIAVGNTLYVSHKGGYNSNDIISVINTETDALTTTIAVNDNPDEMLLNSNGELVVLSSGKPAWTGDETNGAITKINTNTNSISSSLEFPEGTHPELMTYTSGNLYYNVGNAIFKISDAASSLASNEEFTVNATYLYGMSSNNGNLYFADGTDFTSAGKLLIYDQSSYSLINEFDVAQAASKIYFN